MARHPIVVVMTIAVNAVPKTVHAAVVQIAPPKRDHRVVRVEMAAANVAVVKLVAPVVVDQKRDPNRAAPDAKDAQKVDLMLVPNVADQAEAVLKQHQNHAALAVKVLQKLDEMPVQNVDVANAAHKLDKRAPDDVAPVTDVLNSAVDRVALNVAIVEMSKHIVAG